MFRHRKLVGDRNKKDMSGVAAPVGEAGAGALWYKKPTAPLQYPASLGEDPLHSPSTSRQRHHAAAQNIPVNPPYHSPRSPAVETRQTAALRGQSPSLKPIHSPRNAMDSENRSHHGRNGGGSAQRDSPSKYTATLSGSATNLVKAILYGSDWERVSSLLDSERSSIRNKAPMKLLGQNTMAYPLHACVVKKAPVSWTAAAVRSVITLFSHPCHLLSLGCTLCSNPGSVSRRGTYC